MAQKGVVFDTVLTMKHLAQIFRDATESQRGGGRKALEAIARVGGAGEVVGYYTPPFDSPFTSVDGAPDFAIGVNIMKFVGAGKGNGTHVHMYVDDEGEKRSVQLIAKHGLLDASRAEKIARLFFEKFQAADRSLKVTDGNI